MRSPELPATTKNFKLNKFKKFIQNCGGQLLVETNEYEVLRVKTSGGIHVLYKNKSGGLNWPPELKRAWTAYKSGGKTQWKGSTEPTVARKRGRVMIQTLFARDGKKCWYCACKLNMGTVTVEHLLNVCHGGTNHLSNLTVACRPCNQAAKSMCITAKVNMRTGLLKKAGN